MNRAPSCSVQSFPVILTEKSTYQTQFEFMSLSERLSRINERIKNFSKHNPSAAREQLERCIMLGFIVDESQVTQARHLIIALCKDRLIFMRVQPADHAGSMHLEIFVKSSAAQPVKDLMELRFKSWNDAGRI